MFYQVILSRLQGYVRIQVEGYFIERFINHCRNQNIFLWNVKRENSSMMHANIGIREFKRLKRIANKTKCKVKIEGKKGIPFLVHRYQKRKLFLAFLLLLCILLGYLSGFVWNIEIEGNEAIATSEILENLQENGLLVGKAKNKIDTKKIINTIRKERNDLAWIGIEMKGTNAIVKIVEADKKPEIIQEEEYCNIVSEKEGEIVKVDAQTGTAMVKPGDIVKKDSILIAGWMEGKYTGTRYVHAKGEVKARVWYTTRERVSLKQKIREETGNTEKKYRMDINNFQINLYKRLSKFENYDTMYVTKKVKIFSDFYLPVGITECHNSEIIEKEVEYSMEEAKIMALEQAQKKLLEQIPEKEKIENETVNYYESGDSVEVEVTYEVLENIGTNEKIVF